LFCSSSISRVVSQIPSPPPHPSSSSSSIPASSAVVEPRPAAVELTRTPGLVCRVVEPRPPRLRRALARPPGLVISAAVVEPRPPGLVVELARPPGLAAVVDYNVGFLIVF